MTPQPLAPATGGRRVGGVARSILTLGAATAIGQGAVLLASPLLARLYTPADFGLLAVFAAVVTVLLTVSSLRFDMAIPLAESEAEAAGLLLFSLAVAAVATVLLAVVVWVAGPRLAALLGAPALEPLLWLLPPALLVASVGQCVAAWGVFGRSFRALARLRATQGLGQAGAQLGLGLLHAGPLGLVLGDMLGRILGVEGLVRQLTGSVRAARPDARAVLRAARPHWGFARVMAVASVINALSLQVPFLLIPGLFGLDASGQYFLAYRVLVLPASFVGAAVSQVFFGEASHRRDDPARLHAMARDVAVTLLMFAIPTYTVVTIAAPALLQVLFGPDWADAGTYARLTAPGLVLWAVASPMSTLLLVGRREWESLGFTVGELALKTAAILAGAWAGSLALGIAALTVATVLINVGALWRILRVAGTRLADLARPGLRILGATLPFAAVLLVLVLVPGVPDLVILAATAVAWLAAVALGAWASPELRALASGSHD